jgi:hypothetical protein
MNVRLGMLLVAINVLTASSVVCASGSQTSVPLKPYGSSGQIGAATISRTGGDHIIVSIKLNGVPAGASEPVMIHHGSCSDLQPGSQTVLNPVVDGKSISTIVPPALDTGHYAIVIHKGTGSEMNTIVACGDIHIL